VTDNQQEIFDKAYLAGILDGEGSIHIAIAHYKSQNGFKPAVILKPRVNVVANTNSEIVNKIVEILNRYHLPHWVRETQRTKSGKRFYIVMIEGLKRVPKFIQWFDGISFAKRRQLDTLDEFIQLRHRDHTTVNGRNGYPLYGEKEFALYQRCKDLNQRVPQRLHATRPEMDEDIVQTTA